MMTVDDSEQSEEKLDSSSLGKASHSLYLFFSTLFALLMVTVALYWSRGFQSSFALLCLALATLLLLFAFSFFSKGDDVVTLKEKDEFVSLSEQAREPYPQKYSKGLLIRSCWLLLGFQLLLLSNQNPVKFISFGLTFELLPLFVLWLLCFSNSPKLKNVGYYGLFLGFIVLGAGFLWVGNTPQIDVFTVHQESLEAFFQGINPHTITFTNYWPEHSPYPAGATTKERLLFGFPYPTIQLLLSAPGYLITGDYRFSLLINVALTAGLLALLVRGELGKLIALIFLLNPMSFWMIEHGWNETNSVFLFVLAAYVHHHFPRLLPYALGLFFASKQYFVIAMPSVLLLFPRPFVFKPVFKFMTKLAFTGLFVTVPFFLWDMHSFWKYVISAQQVFGVIRADALSLPTWLYLSADIHTGHWFSFVILLPIIILFLRFFRRGFSSFIAAASISYLSLFLWSAHAFCNHFYIQVGLLSCLLAELIHRRK